MATQRTFMTFMNNILKEKNKEKYILGGFIENLFRPDGMYDLPSDPLVNLFINVTKDAIEPFRAKGKVNNNGKEYWVPIKLHEAVDAYGPLSDLNADNAFTYEGDPDFDVFKYPTERHWGFKMRLYAKDQRLYEDQSAVAGGGERLAARQLLKLFGMFRSFSTYFTNRMYLAQSDPQATIDKTFAGDTKTVGTDTYRILKLKRTATDPKIPAHRLQDGMSVDFYDGSSSIVTDKQLFICAPPSGETAEGFFIMSKDLSAGDVTNILAATADPTIWKTGCKGSDFKGWGDFIVNTGSVLNFDITRLYKLMPLIIDRTSSPAIKLNANLATETDAVPWRPIEQIILEYEAKQKMKPDFILISTLLDEYLQRDAQLRGLANTPLDYNTKTHVLHLGGAVASYKGVPIMASPFQPISSVKAIKRKKPDDGSSNFEFVTYGPEEIVADTDQSGNLFIKDQINTYGVAKWFTLFDTVFWPMYQGEVTGITYE